MEYTLRMKFSSLKWIILFGAFSLVAAIATALVPVIGILLLPAYITVLTLLFFSEKGRMPIFSVGVSLVSVVLELVINGLGSFVSLTAVLIALLIFLSITRGLFSKGESALIACAILSIAIGAIFLFSIFREIGSYDFSLALDYIESLISDARQSFVTFFEKAMESYTSSLPTGGESSDFTEIITPELLGEMFDTYIDMLISVVVIFAFLIVGLAFKLFGTCFGAILEDKTPLAKWRFELSAIFAYFYIVCYFLSIFLVGDGIFAIAVFNFTNVFTFIFAYLGFVSLAGSIGARFNSKAIAYLILIGSLVLLYQLAINILAIVGVFAMIRLSKARRLEGEGGDKKL